MSIIDSLFANLRLEGKKAFLPFITAGDPDLEFTVQVLDRLESLGCSMAEVGVPYSDPIADGPVIQASYTRALQSKIKLQEIFAAIKRHQLIPRERSRGATKMANHAMPLVTMASYAIIHRRGHQAFVEQAQAAGFAGAIVPDLLVEESRALADVCRKADFSLIQLVTPTTPPDRALRIAEQSMGFLYFVSVTGITGERQELPPGLVDRIDWLRQRTSLPICVGFGVSRPEHVRLLAPVADGLIVGSAIVRLMGAVAQVGRKVALDRIEDLVRSLIDALSESK